MLNNVQDKVRISTSAYPKARFNLSHDVNSTYQFGETQPVVCKLMLPEEKDVVQISSMVRLSPMVAPTFGRIKHKEWHHFIPMTDLFPHYGNLLAGSSYKGFSPTNIPNMSLALLSYLTLIGARMTIYAGQVSSTVDEANTTYTLYKNPKIGQTTQFVDNVLAHINEYQQQPSGYLPFGFNRYGNSPIFGSTSGPVIDISYLINPFLFSPNTQGYRHFNIPIGNWDTSDFFDYDDYSVEGTQFTYVTDTAPVSLDTADAVIPYYIKYNSGSTEQTLLLAFKMSNFGRRLYKILIGCGYQLDFNSLERVSLMPLFAYYKAWFDSFGLTRYKSWTDTYAFKLLFSFDTNPSFNDFDPWIRNTSGSQFYNSQMDFFGWIVELGSTFVTEDLDFVSAHTKDQPLTNGPGSAGTSVFPAMPDRSQVPVSVNSSNVLSNGISYANPIGTALSNPAPVLSSLTRLDALSVKELLKLYKWTNKNTVAGREVERLLRAQGYGYYLYSCKSNFIGYTSQNVPIYDVVNSSDTYNATDGQGMLLGEYAGRGLGYEESKSMSFEADEHGYWIGICAVVPESGYTQGLDPTITAIDKWKMYQSEFDGFGYEITPKSVVCGSMPFSDSQNINLLKDGFGFIPRYSGFKVARNVSNGGFSLRSGKDIFRPYMLDKFIDVGERFINFISSDSDKSEYRVAKIFQAQYFPEAGDWWRFVNRYPWLGNLDRIFARAVRNSDVINQLLYLSTQGAETVYEFITQSDDNFMIHHVVNQTMFARMRPISESFGTEDEDNNTFNDSLEHA